jgi:glucokinase
VYTTRAPIQAPGGDVVLAVDVGDTRISVGLVTLAGELIDRDSLLIEPEVKAEALFAGVTTMVEAQLDRARNHHHLRPIAVGVGAAGPIGPNVETIAPVGIPAWRNFALRSRLAAISSLPVFGDLDAKALALAEGWLGAAQGSQNFMAIAVGTSIAGGIVLNGQLLEGATGHAGQVGHIILEPNGHRCACGARGCLEAEASGSAVLAITGRPTSQPTYEIMQRSGRLVGNAVASVCNLLDLDLVVVGGGVALSFAATFFNAAQEALDEHVRIAYAKGARITPVRLGDRGPLIGAGAIAVRGLNRQRRNARR